jgi:hypothetical protein
MGGAGPLETIAWVGCAFLMALLWTGEYCAVKVVDWGGQKQIGLPHMEVRVKIFPSMTILLGVGGMGIPTVLGASLACAVGLDNPTS